MTTTTAEPTVDHPQHILDAIEAALVKSWDENRACTDAFHRDAVAVLDALAHAGGPEDPRLQAAQHALADAREALADAREQVDVLLYEAEQLRQVRLALATAPDGVLKETTADGQVRELIAHANEAPLILALYGVGPDPEGFYAGTAGSRVRALVAAEKDRDKLAQEVAEYRAIFDQQTLRVSTAVELWRAEDPAERELTTPDLGRLVAWLIARGDARDDADLPHRDLALDGLLDIDRGEAAP